MDKKTKLLFICTANMRRSPTAASLFDNSIKYEAKSAGIHPLAPQPVTQKLLYWSDKIFVMNEKEDGHFSFLRENFDIEGLDITDLDISDRFATLDPQLVSIIKEKLSPHIEL